jgi:hypothetical protein
MREIAFTKKLIAQLRVFSAKTRVLRLAANAVSLSNRIKRRLAFYMNSQETGGFLQREHDNLVKSKRLILNKSSAREIY